MTLLLIIAALLCALVVALCLTAPEGWEDEETGFHFGPRDDGALEAASFHGSAE